MQQNVPTSDALVDPFGVRDLLAGGEDSRAKAAWALLQLAGAERRQILASLRRDDTLRDAYRRASFAAACEAARR